MANCCILRFSDKQWIDINFDLYPKRQKYELAKHLKIKRCRLDKLRKSSSQWVSVVNQHSAFEQVKKILFFEQVKQSKGTPPISTSQLCHLPLTSVHNTTEERNFYDAEGIFEKTIEGVFSRRRISEKYQFVYKSSVATLSNT